MSTPTEAQMREEHFGPSQIRGFVTEMLGQMFSPSYLPSISTKEMEDSTVIVDIDAPRVRITIYKTGRSHWNFIVDRHLPFGEHSVSFTQPDLPFNIIKQVISIISSMAVDEWLAKNYDCAS